MSKVLIEEQTLYDIGDAIRGKNGEETTYNPGQMAQAISQLMYDNITTMDIRNGAPSNSYGRDGDIYLGCYLPEGTGSRGIWAPGLSGAGESGQNLIGYTFAAKKDFQITKLVIRAKFSSNHDYTMFFVLKRGDDVIYETPSGLRANHNDIGAAYHDLADPISIAAGEQYTILGYAGPNGYYNAINTENHDSRISDYIRIINGVYATISNSDGIATANLHTDLNNMYSADIYIPLDEEFLFPPYRIYYKHGGSWTLYRT